ncbi:hypothetical protein GCM10009122_52450 [Fulvivirga kasyanovii]
MIAISPTDLDWFEFLRESGFNNEINFWTPTPWNITGLGAGDKLYFMLKSPIRKIGGFGEFKEYVNLPLSVAWSRFGKKNGCKAKQELVDRLDKYKNKRSTDPESILTSEIGCIVLDNVEFWDTESYLDLKNYEIDFPSNIVKIKYFNQLNTFDTNYYKSLTNGFNLVEDSQGKYKKTREVVQRKGQSSFRVKISKAYNGACCITGEQTPELVECAHIQPYLNYNSNHVQNGLLLRADFHKLYDNGLLYINQDYKIEVSPLINGDYYKRFHGKTINLPKSKADYPSKEALTSRKFEFRNE